MLCAALMAGCGGASQPQPTTPVPGAAWHPLPTSPVPTADEIRADRLAFLGHVQHRSSNELDRARRYERGGRLMGVVGITTAALGMLFLGWDATEATTVGMPSVLTGYLLRMKGTEQGHCGAALVQMADAFDRKWTAERIPTRTAEWLEYRGDQETISNRGPCRGEER